MADTPTPPYVLDVTDQEVLDALQRAIRGMCSVPDARWCSDPEHRACKDVLFKLRQRLDRSKDT